MFTCIVEDIGVRDQFRLGGLRSVARIFSPLLARKSSGFARILHNFLPKNCYFKNSRGATAPPPPAPRLVRLWWRMSQVWPKSLCYLCQSKCQFWHALCYAFTNYPMTHTFCSSLQYHSSVCYTVASLGLSLSFESDKWSTILIQKIITIMLDDFDLFPGLRLTLNYSTPFSRFYQNVLGYLAKLI